MTDLEYYTQQSPITNPKHYATAFEGLPNDVGELFRIVQGLVVHRDSSHLYNLELTDERKQEGETRTVPDMLARIFAHDLAPLAIKRPPEKRFAGVCRHFELLLCSMLRSKGIPARLRCGFAGYFTAKFEDHWLCEYWNAEQARWVLVDANVDDVEREAYKVTIDVLDIPHDKFLFAGNVWRQCRSGAVDPSKFGVSSIGISGLWFVRNNVIRDLAALNKLEVLPWDEWGLADKDFDQMSESDLRLIDKAAQLTTALGAFDEMRSFYEGSDLFKVPRSVKSHTTYTGVQMVETLT